MKYLHWLFDGIGLTLIWLVLVMFEVTTISHYCFIPAIIGTALTLISLIRHKDDILW